MAQHRIFAMPFARVCPLYVQKAERKGRTQAATEIVLSFVKHFSRYAEGVSYLSPGSPSAAHPGRAPRVVFITPTG